MVYSSMCQLYVIIRLFTEAEINEIKSTTFRDVMINATDITDAEIQKDVFYWRNGS